MAEILDRRISFNAGEISPWLDPRLDLDKYRMGCRTLENMRPSIYGGAFGRSGTSYLGPAATASTAVRLIPFTREISTNYLLEFSNLKLRVWDAATLTPVASVADGPWGTGASYLVGDVVTEAGANYEVIVAHTSGTFAADLAALKLRLYPYQEITTPYTAAQLDQVQFAQQNDVLFLSHPEHFPRLVARLEDGTWKMSNINIDWPATLGPNISLTKITPLVDIYKVGEPAAWSSVTAAANNYDTGAQVKHSSLYYISTADNNTTTPGTDAAFGKWIEGTWINATAPNTPAAYSSAVYYVTGDKITYNSLTYVRTSMFSGERKGHHPGEDSGPLQLWDTAATPGVDSAAGMVPKGGNVVLKSSAATWSADHVGTKWVIGHRRDDIKVSFSPNAQTSGYVTGALYVLGEWTAQVTQPSSPTSAFNVEVIIERSTDLINWEPHYALNSQLASVQQLLTGNEELPLFLRLKLRDKSGSVPSAMGIELVAGNPLHNGIVQILSYTSSTQVTAVVLTPLYRYLPTTAWEEPAWTGVYGYPRAVTLHENRLFYGGNKRKPTTIWGSAIDAYQDFRLAAADDRAVSYTLASDESSAIEWLVSQDMLVIGTSSGEWVMGARPGDEAPKLRRNTSFGSAPIQARAIADALVFVQRSRRKVREFAWSFERDGYQANDLIMLSEHLGDAEFRQIAIQRNPESVVWVVTTRGDLLSLTYERGQNVAGWARHVTDGSIESVAVVSGDGEEDHIWLAVKRTINGAVKRYIERIVPDQTRAIKDGERAGLVYSDCSLTIAAVASAESDIKVTGCENAGVSLYVPKLINVGLVVSRPSFMDLGGIVTLAAELPVASYTYDAFPYPDPVWEAVTPGAAGNSITVEVQHVAAVANEVVVTGNAVVLKMGKSGCSVTGSLTSDGSTPVVFPDMVGGLAAINPGPIRIYNGFEGGGCMLINDPNLIAYAYEWNLIHSSGAEWGSNDMWSTWTPVGSETGTPSIGIITSTAGDKLSDAAAAIAAYGPSAALVTLSPATSTGYVMPARSVHALTGGSDTPFWRLTVNDLTWIAASAETYPWDIAAEDWSATSPATGTPVITLATSLFTGLDHLEGKTVSILADGMPHRALTVTGGEITLDRPAVTAVVGLLYDMILEPTWFETMDPQSVSKQGRKRLTNVLAQFWETLGCVVSVNDGSTWEPVSFQNFTIPDADALPLFTGTKDLTVNSGTAREVSVMLKQSQPLPFNIMSIGSRYTVEMS